MLQVFNGRCIEIEAWHRTSEPWHAPRPYRAAPGALYFVCQIRDAVVTGSVTANALGTLDGFAYSP